MARIRATFLTLLGLGLALGGCHRGDERGHPYLDPPPHLSRIERIAEAVPSFWDPNRSGLLPPIDLDDAEALYAAEERGPSVGIACRARFDGYRERPWLMRKPSDALADLTVTTWLGVERGAFFFRVEGPEDRNDLTFAIPLSGLKKDDAFVVHFGDRDFASTTEIDLIDAPLGADGETFTLGTSAAKGELSCRGFGQSARDERFAAHEKVIAAAFARMDSMAPVSHARDFGKDEAAFRAGRDAVTSAIALVGWDEPRGKQLLDRLRRAEDALEARFTAAFDAERAKTPRSGTESNGYRVVVVGSGASAAMTITNVDGVPERVSSLAAFTDAIDRTCARHSLVAPPGAPELLEPGVGVTLRLQAPAKGTKVEGPLLIRGEFRGSKAGTVPFAVATE